MAFAAATSPLWASFNRRTRILSPASGVVALALVIASLHTAVTVVPRTAFAVWAAFVSNPICAALLGLGCVLWLFGKRWAGALAHDGIRVPGFATGRILTLLAAGTAAAAITMSASRELDRGHCGPGCEISFLVAPLCGLAAGFVTIVVIGLGWAATAFPRGSEMRAKPNSLSLIARWPAAALAIKLIAARLVTTLVATASAAWCGRSILVFVFEKIQHERIQQDFTFWLIAADLLPAFVFFALLGMGEWLAMRSRVGPGWVLATVLGGLAANAYGVVIFRLFRTDLAAHGWGAPIDLFQHAAMAGGGLVMGLYQWFALRSVRRSAIFWIPVSALAALAALIVAEGTDLYFLDTVSAFIRVVFACAVWSLLSGGGMASLLRAAPSAERTTAGR